MTLRKVISMLLVITMLFAICTSSVLASYAELTEAILAEYIKTTVLDEKLIERSIDKIYVDADGRITLKLISGAII